MNLVRKKWNVALNGNRFKGEKVYQLEYCANIILASIADLKAERTSPACLF